MTAPQPTAPPGADRLTDLVTSVAAGVAARTAQVLTGESGIGKSTLAAEIADRMSIPTFIGGALATLSWMEHLCLRRALDRDLAGADASAVALEVQDAVGDGLLVLEDLHWASPSTLVVVGLLANRIRLLATVRSGSHDADRAIASLLEAGFTQVRVEPWDDESAATLIRGSGAVRSAQDEERILRLAGGNPLLLVELARHDVPPASLRLSMAARLRDLDPVSRATFDLVALAGRPLSRTLLGSTELAGLEAAGLVLVGGGADRTVTARHALLAETAVGLMDDVRRRQAHATVARLIADPGESARHHEQAGERELALDKALRAADGAGTQLERAGHLRLAARMASGPEADRLRLRAARVFDAVQDWVAALEVLDAIEDTDPEVQAWVALLTARSAWKAGRADLLRSAIDTGLALTEGVGSEVAVRLRVESTRVPLLVEFDVRTAVDRAGEGLTLARRTGVAVGRALYYLGTAVSLVDDPAAVGLLVEAIDRADAEGDIETEFAAAYNLINYHEFAGDPVAGRRLAERMIERAEELRYGVWVSGLTEALAGLLFHAGELQATLDTCRRVLERPADVRTRDTAVERELLSLLDLGRIDEAERRAAAWAERAADDHVGQSLLVLIRAEAALWGGHPRRALTLAEQYLEGIQGDTNLAFGLPTRAWAQLDAGIEPQPMTPLFLRRMLSGVPDEVTGVGLLAQGEPEAAADLFSAAARAWAPYHKRGDLRCRWAQGEALRRAGAEQPAIDVLEQVEADAELLGHGLILGRIRQSLRRLGVQRSAERTGSPGGLSGREHEVLELAGQGLTNAQIGARLGIARRTVVSLVETASVKLGAASRSQAVALAAAVGEGGGPHHDPTVSVG